MEPLEFSVVRIFFRNSNEVAGAGFLITKKHVLTCAHVINTISDGQTDGIPSLLVKVQFPFLAGSPQLDAKVVLWHPPSPENSDDVTVLEIVQGIPREAFPVRLSNTELGQSDNFKAYGFPEGYPNGIWAVGFLRGKLANGRFQIEDLRQTGYFIEPGFSGTAVWSEPIGSVVGMVVSADADRSTRTAFMLPTQRIREFIGDALPDLQTVYHHPAQKSEKLTTNLLKVESFAPHIYVATATKKKARDVIDALINRRFDGDEWLLKGGNIISFYNLDEAHWADACDQGTVEQFDVEEWAYSTDEDRLREFVYLLNKCLQAKVRDDLRYHKEKDHYYFHPTSNLKLRMYQYHSDKQKAERQVFAPYGKMSDGRPYYYRHSAFSGHFRCYDDTWYLELSPTYHFTINGFEIHPKYEDFIKKIKQLEHNDAVLGQVRMWAYYLSQPGDMISPAYPFLAFGQLISMDADFGINDHEWLPQEETKPSQTSDDVLLI